MNNESMHQGDNVGREAECVCGASRALWRTWTFAHLKVCNVRISRCWALEELKISRANWFQVKLYSRRGCRLYLSGFSIENMFKIEKSEAS